MKRILPKRHKEIFKLLFFFLFITYGNAATAATKTWTGAVSTDPTIAANWSPATVLGTNDDITVPVTANMPVFATTASLRSMKISAGATVTQTSGTLSINGGSITIYGTFTQSGGIVYTDHSFTVYTGGVFNQLAGLVHLAKNATTNPSDALTIQAGAVVNQTGGTFYTKDYASSPGTFNQTGSSALLKIYHDFKPGAGSVFNSTAGIVEFTGNAGTANFASGSKQFTNVIVDAGVNPHFDQATNSLINIAGNFTNNNTALNVGTNATFKINGPANQTITSASTGTNATFGNLIIKKTGGIATLASNVLTAGNITINSGTLDQSIYTNNRKAAGGTFTLSAGALLRLAGTTGGKTGSNYPANFTTTTISSGSTIEYYGSGQTIYASNYGNLMVTSAGTKTAGGALTVQGNFTLSSATFVGGTYTHNIGGNWTMSSGVFTNASTIVDFNGAINQVIFSTGAFNNITINKTAGSATLATDVTTTTITFTKGLLTTTANYKLIIPSNGGVTGASQATGWVYGNLQKYFTTGTASGNSFEVGGYAYYSPVTALAFTGISTAGSLICNVTPNAHPNVCGTTITSKNIGRYWTLTKPATGALAYTSAAMTFNWNLRDNYSGMTATALKVANYYNSAWAFPAISGTPTTTTIALTGVANTGDFAVGEVSSCTVSSGFSYSSTLICSNGSALSPTWGCSASAGAFTVSPAGLSINSATGAISPGASTAGTYTITNTVTGSCTAKSVTTVMISTQPSAAISYSAANFCQSAGTITPVITGTTGGYFTSATGLDLDYTTGKIDLTNSDPGTYTVTYNIPSSSPCINYTTTTILTVSAANYANIAYLSNAYCSNGGIAAVDFEGTTGGTFSSSAGLSLNAGTGVITLASSTAGTYTVTYSGPAANGCAAFTATTPITITASSPGTISYATPFCSNGAVASVTVTGTNTGVFTAPAALSVDYGTGDIDPSLSSVGTYTVTYDLGGCYSTTNVTINAAPSATITYTGAPFCKSVATAQAVIVTGTTGGTFSASPAGLTINSTTGEITPSSSTAGTYVITYTPPANGGCAGTAATATVIIVSAPTATISYGTGSYCPTGLVTVSQTGTTGGTYSSTTGLSIDALTGTITLGTSSAGTYTVTYTIAAAGGCSAFSTTANITIIAPGTWTGAASTAWTNTLNWQCGVLPDNTTDVTIPSGLSNYPLINSTTPAAKSLTLGTNTTITITNGSLKIAGTVSGSGKIISTQGKVEFNGTTAQTIPANLFNLNTVKDLVITNAAGVTLAGTLRLSNSLTFGNVNNSTFNTGGYLTLGSTSSATAFVGDITNGGINSGNNISGNVTIERFITGRRAYRFLTAPVNTATSIRANWMENTNNPSAGVNNNPNPGYGTQITGAGGAANGFDPTGTNNPSMFTYNLASQTWATIPNTGGSFSAGNGYRIMVRGSRSVDLTQNSPAPSATTLRATGTLVTGNVVMAKAGGAGTVGMPNLTADTGKYSFIANPYASAVNWQLLDKNDISNTIYVFDPTVSGTNGRGAYVVYNGLLNSNNLVNSFITKDIQPGQAFFVQTTGTNPSLTFKESYKSGVRLPVFRSTTDPAKLSIGLQLQRQTGTDSLADGVAVFFSDNFSNSIGDDDSYKFSNLDENIAINRNGTLLSLEGRKNITANDTVQLKMWQLVKGSYSFKTSIENFAPDVEAYFYDEFTQSMTKLNNNDTAYISFDITADAASSLSDRFKVVFKVASTMPLSITSVNAYAKNKGVKVDWTAESEVNVDHYEVERSGNAVGFTKLGSVAAENKSLSKYSYFDAEPLTSAKYYRIKAVDKSSVVKYSRIVKVTGIEGVGTVNVVPNPVQGNSINLVFTDMENGSYKLVLLNNAGQPVYMGSVKYNGGTESKVVKVNSGLPSGIYQMKVSNDKNSYDVSVMVE